MNTRLEYRIVVSDDQLSRLVQSAINAGIRPQDDIREKSEQQRMVIALIDDTVRGMAE